MGAPVAETVGLTEVDRGAIAWELTGMLGINIRPSADGWALDGDQTITWWNGLESWKRAAIIDGYRRALVEEQSTPVARDQK